MGVIEDIYRNTLQPSEGSMNRDKKYRQAKNQINQYYQNLLEKLPQREHATLDKLMECYDIKTEKKNAYCFKAGCKTGLAAALEALK